jgi:hypothetical protein
MYRKIFTIVYSLINGVKNLATHSMLKVEVQRAEIFL